MRINPFVPRPNPEQRAVIEAGPAEPLFIVAGPGTGKTATLTLRILKLILVDGLPPRGILATTFTKKAAAELRSRILSWGFRLFEELIHVHTLDWATQEWFKKHRHQSGHHRYY
jgi:DNA helicase-2/ATP-dependent DNA helicase PcrA